MSRAAHRARIDDGLIDGIYDAAVGAKPWTEVLGELRALFGCCAALVNVKEVGRGSGEQVGVDPETMRIFFERYAGRNPLAVRGWSAPIGTVMTDRSLMPKADLLRTEYYHNFLRPQDQHALMILRAARGRAGAAVVDVALARDPRRGEFEESDVALFKRLAPHLRRAVMVRMRLTEAETERHALAETLDRLASAAFVLDASGAVRFANAAAAALLASGDGLRMEPGNARLLTARSSETAALQRMTAAAVSNEQAGLAAHLHISRPPPRAPLIATALPLRAAAADTLGLGSLPSVLLLVTDPEAAAPSAAAEVLRAVFGLTETEATVALRVACGTEPAQVAAALGASPATIRTHLHRIFAKTGTHRQAELAALLGRLATTWSSPRSWRPRP